jgi:hypothetical protein
MGSRRGVAGLILVPGSQVGSQLRWIVVDGGGPMCSRRASTASREPFSGTTSFARGFFLPLSLVPRAEPYLFARGAWVPPCVQDGVASCRLLGKSVSLGPGGLSFKLQQSLFVLSRAGRRSCRLGIQARHWYLPLALRALSMSQRFGRSSSTCIRIR